MPYKRRFSRKPRYVRRRRFTRKTGGWMNLAKKAFRVATRVASLVNAEYKDYYSTQSTFATGNDIAVLSLNGGITQGTADGQRTGDSIKCKTVTIRGDLKRNGVDDIVRIIVFWDKQNDITQSNLLEYRLSSQVTNAPKDDDEYYNSKFLLDKKYIITADSPVKMFNYVIKLNQHSKYNNSTNAIDTGALKIAIMSQAASASGTNCQYVSKLTFLDN